MAGDTKARIAQAALALFAQNGYLGTSMSDIAQQLGITKGALYKHYASKQEILDQIIQKMNDLDLERAQAYGMPENEANGFAEEYVNTPTEKIRTYSIAQFRHWTEEEFSSCFRRMLTLEQYRSKETAALYHKYLAAGPFEYMTAVFKEFASSEQTARQLALEFYGPVHLLYSLYDSAEDKDSVIRMMQEHTDRFIAGIEARSMKL